MLSLESMPEFVPNEGVSEDSLSLLTVEFPGLPADYLSFLRMTNGGEGFVGNEYVLLWRPEEIKQFNLEYEAHVYAPAFLLIGSNGGGEAYAFDTHETPWHVVRIPFIGMDPKYADSLGESFSDFLDSLLRSSS